MNILFLMKAFEVGGQEVVTATLAAKFVSHGHHVCIACFNEPSEIMKSRLDKRICFFKLYGFRYSDKNVYTLHKILKENNINIVINQWGLPYIPAKVLKKASKRLLIKSIAVYHNSPDTNARIKDIEIVLDKTNNKIKRSILKLKKQIFKIITSHSMRYVYNHSNIYIVLSPSFVNKFIEFTKLKNISKLRVQTNPITIDATNYNYDISNKQKEIIYVGRIDYNQKRVYRIIDTWALLESIFPDWKLTIVGDGVEKQSIKEQAKRLYLKNISFEGFKPPQEYYKRASLLILTSEYEGFPLVLTECMSYGVIPIVYGSYSAVYDIIQDGINGIVIRPEPQGFNQKIMANGISEVIKNTSSRDQMAIQAIKTSKEYSLDKIYDSWNNLFKELSN